MTAGISRGAISLTNTIQLLIILIFGESTNNEAPHCANLPLRSLNKNGTLIVTRWYDYTIICGR